MNLIELGESIGVRGFLHCLEADRLSELAAGKDVCEIGAYAGLSAWLMGMTAKSLVSIDSFKACSNGQRQESFLTTLDDYKRAVSRYTNVKPPVIATSEQAAPMFPNASFQFIFIDADHQYTALRDDIQRWWPKLKPGGTMAFHDYRHGDFPGVEQAIDEIFGPAPEGTTCVTLRWVVKPA